MDPIYVPLQIRPVLSVPRHHPFSLLPRWRSPRKSSGCDHSPDVTIVPSPLTFADHSAHLLKEGQPSAAPESRVNHPDPCRFQSPKQLRRQVRWHKPEVEDPVRWIWSVRAQKQKEIALFSSPNHKAPHGISGNIPSDLFLLRLWPV